MLKNDHFSMGRSVDKFLGHVFLGTVLVAVSLNASLYAAESNPKPDPCDPSNMECLAWRNYARKNIRKYRSQAANRRDTIKSLRSKVKNLKEGQKKITEKAVYMERTLADIHAGCGLEGQAVEEEGKKTIMSKPVHDFANDEHAHPTIIHISTDGVLPGPGGATVRCVDAGIFYATGGASQVSSNVISLKKTYDGFYQISSNTTIQLQSLNYTLSYLNVHVLDSGVISGKIGLKNSYELSPIGSSNNDGYTEHIIAINPDGTFLQAGGINEDSQNDVSKIVKEVIEIFYEAE